MMRAYKDRVFGQANSTKLFFAYVRLLMVCNVYVCVCLSEEIIGRLNLV